MSKVRGQAQFRKKKVTNKQNYIKKKCWGEKIRKTKLGRISKLVLYLI